MRCQCGKYTKQVGLAYQWGMYWNCFSCACGALVLIPVGETVTPNPAQRQPKLKGLSV